MFIFKVFFFNFQLIFKLIAFDFVISRTSQNVVIKIIYLFITTIFYCTVDLLRIDLLCMFLEFSKASLKHRLLSKSL